MTEPSTHPDSAGEDHGARWPDGAEPTGDAAVDQVLGLLGAVPAAEVADHAGLYGAVHDALMEALDAEPGMPPTGHMNPERALEGDS